MTRNNQKSNKKKTTDGNNTSKKKDLHKVKGWVGDHFVESVLIDSEPYFLCYNKSTKHLEYHQSIDTVGYTVKPLELSQYGYEPYSFKKDEIDNLISQNFIKQQMLDEIMEHIEKFLYMTDLDKHLIQGDILMSYCLEWVNTLHFLFFIGDNESGKSSALHLARWLCYRCHLGEDIPMADVYNYLGYDEEGCGTIAEDEAQEIGKDRVKIRMYKASYAKGAKKARIIGVDTSAKRQVFYNTFCPKLFAGESLPNDKGFKERIIPVHMIQGNPPSNIKRLDDNDKKKLLELRNKLLIWKLCNINKKPEQHKSGLQMRDQELWEDYLTIMHQTKYMDKAKEVVSFYTNQRHKIISNSFEARILKLLVQRLGNDMEVGILDFWDYIIQNLDLPGKLDDRTTKTFYPDEFNMKLTLNSLSKLLEEKFDGNRVTRYEKNEGKACQRTVYRFKRDEILSLSKKYNKGLNSDSTGNSGPSGQGTLIPT